MVVMLLLLFLHVYVRVCVDKLTAPRVRDTRTKVKVNIGPL